jgi:hypothetical protein
MSTWARRGVPAAAVAYGVLTLAVALASVPLWGVSRISRVPGGGPYSGLLSWLVVAVALVPGVAMGTLLAARRPGNPIGWLLLTIFLLGVSPAGAYAIIDYRMHHGTLPLGSVAVALLADWPVWLLLIALLLWLFPDGHLPGRGRWRRWRWCCSARWRRRWWLSRCC